MVNFDEIKNKAQDAFETAKDKASDGLEAVKGKVEEVTQSDGFENVTEKVLDGAASAANTVTGGRYEEKVDDVRDNLDAKIGKDDTGEAGKA